MSITSVKFAGASMECVARMEPLSVDEDGDARFGFCRSVFSCADVYMYRHDIRAVSFNDKSVWVYDTQGNRFTLEVGDENTRDVAIAIGNWRMAASERWEAESRPRPVSRRAKPKPKPKPSAKKDVDDDDDLAD